MEHKYYDNAHPLQPGSPHLPVLNEALQTVCLHKCETRRLSLPAQRKLLSALFVALQYSRLPTLWLVTQGNPRTTDEAYFDANF